MLNVNGKWMFNIDLDGEWCNEYCVTREEAISKGMDLFKSNNDYQSINKFYIGQLIMDIAQIPDGEDIIEMIASRTTDNSYGDHSEDYLDDVTSEDEKQLTEDLKKTIGNWLNRTNNNPTWFTISNSEEVELIR